jgi:hypothetical protein
MLELELEYQVILKTKDVINLDLMKVIESWN